MVSSGPNQLQDLRCRLPKARARAHIWLEPAEFSGVFNNDISSLVLRAKRLSSFSAWMAGFKAAAMT